ncbi:hypothetical protein K492DRAFT_173173 [Lichtheimia hyalospora FSU 10163]|nr:hypothetical protein K492DRAFT_173173 [Lichtheimia hyalospora FSU 10163]
MASRQIAQARQQTQAYRQDIHGTNAPDVRVYMPSYHEYLSAQRQYGGSHPTAGNVEMGSVQPPPPVYKAEDQPPPSYQDYNKDVRIQAAASSSAN